jgi:hypothetical protein
MADVEERLSNHRDNRRTDLQGYAAWEIHPVMKLKLSDAAQRDRNARAQGRFPKGVNALDHPAAF